MALLYAIGCGAFSIAIGLLFGFEYQLLMLLPLIIVGLILGKHYGR